MNINFTPARTVAEATHYFHLRDSVVFPVGEYAERYPDNDAVLPMVLSVQVEQPTPPQRAASYYDAIDMMYAADAYSLRAYAEAGKKINAIKGLRDYAKGQGFSILGLKDAKEAVEAWMSDNGHGALPADIERTYNQEARYAEQDDYDY